MLPAGTEFADLITFTNLPSGLRFDPILVTEGGVTMLQLFAIFGIDASFLGGLSPQAQGIGGYVNQVLFNAEGTTATEDALADLAGLSDVLIPQAISSLSPQPYGALSLTAISQASAVADSLDDHMMRRQNPEGMSLWATGIGSFSSRDGNASQGTAGMDNNLYGVMAGVDMTLSNGILLGGFIGSANHDQTFDGLRAENDTDNVFVGAYAGLGGGNLSFGVMAYHGFGNASTERYIPFAGESLRGEGDFDHTVIGSKLSYHLGLGDWVATPSAELLYLTVDRGAVTEAGSAALAYDVAGGTQDFLLLDTSLRLGGSYSSGGGTELIPEITLGYRQELLNETGRVSARFSGASGAPFGMAGSPYDGGRAILGGGMTARFAGGIDLFAHYDGEFGSGNTDHRVTAGAQLTF